MAPLFVLTQYISWVGVELTPLSRAGELAIVMVMSFLGYLVAGRAVGVPEISMIRQLFDSFAKRSSSSE